MTKPNLSGARAKLNWAQGQIHALHAQIDAFVQKNAEPIAPHPQFTHAQIIRKDRVIPDEIKTAAGMIIQAQRDSLDYLVHALAVNNGATKLAATEFPIVNSEARLSDKRTRRKIAELAPADQAAILALKPYKGGNNVLYALNWLCNKSKHRDLIVLAQNIAGIRFGPKPNTPGGHLRKFAAWHHPEGEIVALDADPNIQLDIAFTVAFREVPEAQSQPVIEMLGEFSRLAASIIDLFEQG
jgi:hypothetical protein